MADVPVTIVLTARPRHGWYKARMLGYGVPQGGRYGSLWARDLELNVTDRATATEVVRAVAAALLASVDGPQVP